MAVANREKLGDFTVLENQQIPDAGLYNATKPFGSGMNRVDFGTKTQFKPNRNPGPGQYEADQAKSKTMAKGRSATIVQHPQFAIY